ncbi:MAG: RecX family transcriptional regulator [Proteobacteria bacterium]|nr:RecX family transcriptional regulator [Pseudomonadota bacterium]
MGGRESGTGGGRRRGPRRASAAALEAAALVYLGRYAATAASLRRVLMRRVERSVRAHGGERAAGARLVEVLIARLAGAGLLDDRATARAAVRSLHARGTSRRHIAARLRQKGVAPEWIGEALAALAEESPEPELAAAFAYARRRRLGPYRQGPASAARREKDLAALARAGFPLDIARKVLEAEEAP